MSARIIAISNKKGGVSKTSTGIFLCTALAHNGSKNIYFDCDSQASAYEYRQLEKRMPIYEGVQEPYKIYKKDPAYILDEIEDYKDDYDNIFIDLPRFTKGTEDKMTIALLALCDTILIPVKSGELDSLSTLAFVQMVQAIAERKVKRNKPYKYAAFLSMAGRRSTDDADAREFVKSLNVPMIENELRDVRELSRPYTFESLLNKTKAERERFEPFYNEVVNLFNL